MYKVINLIVGFLYTWQYYRIWTTHKVRLDHRTSLMKELCELTKTKTKKLFVFERIFPDFFLLSRFSRLLLSFLSLLSFVLLLEHFKRLNGLPFVGFKFGYPDMFWVNFMFYNSNSKNNFLSSLQQMVYSTVYWDNIWKERENVCLCSTKSINYMSDVSQKRDICIICLILSYSIYQDTL